MAIFTRPFFKTLLLSCLLSAYLTPVAAAWPVGGGPPPNPSPPSAPAEVIGPITITWYPSSSAWSTTLQERVSGGAWATVSASNSNGTITLSRSPGVYYYRIKEMGFTDDPWEPMDYTAYSSEIAVTVLSTVVPVFDGIAEQIGYEFIFTGGDINNDGRPDIYIERTTGDLDNGVLAQAIIIAQADGSYARFLPTTAQLQTAQAWVPLDVAYEIGDFNLDEVGDLTIAGLPNNARQHLLVSSGAFFHRNAIAVIEMTDAIEQFYGDLAASVTDQGHFDGAMLAQVPGYNVRIVVRATVCIYLYSIPLCYSQDFVVVDEDVSLADLGLDNFLGATSSKSTTASAAKIASQRTQLESAAVYYAPTVYNAAAVTMSDYDISTLAGTAAQKSTALNTMSDVLPSDDPEVLVCVYYCGWSVSYGYDMMRIFSWVDIWTPIMMGPAFDESAYSRDAYDIAQIMDNGAEYITDAQWLTVSSILSAAVDIPFPSDWPADDPRTRDLKKLGLFSRIFLGVWAIIKADEFNDYLRPKLWLNHYTGPAGTTGIAGSGEVISETGTTYWTRIAFPTAVMAEKWLALCGETPIGYFQVRIGDVQDMVQETREVSPKVCESWSVKAGTSRWGGGWEWLLDSGVPVNPANWWPVLPDW